MENKYKMDELVNEAFLDIKKFRNKKHQMENILQIKNAKYLQGYLDGKFNGLSVGLGECNKLKKINNCLNRRCPNQINDGEAWCSMECKEQFLLDHYSDTQCDNWFKENHEKHRKSQKLVLQALKDSGMSASEFIKSLGNFKEEITGEKFHRIWENE
jgi:hypothetical protein